MVKKTILMVSVLILIIIGLITYIIIFSPTAVKPYIEKPNITETVETQHVSWLVNELGSYKLADDSKIELISDDKNYLIEIEDGYPNVIEGTGDADIKITVSEEDILLLVESENIKSSVTEMYANGSVIIEPIKEEQDLILKGYLGLYNEITGQFLLA